MLGTFQFLPFILLTIPAGVWVDRMRRRPILIGANIGRARRCWPRSRSRSWAAGCPSGSCTSSAFAVGCLEVFFDVAYQSYLPSVVERDQLVGGQREAGALGVGHQLHRAGRRRASWWSSSARRSPSCSTRELCRRHRAPASSGDRRRRRSRTTRQRATRPSMRQRGGRGPALRPRAPIPAQHRRLHRHAQPVRQHRRRDPAPLRRARSWAEPRHDRHRPRHRQPRGARRRADRGAGRAAGSASGPTIVWPRPSPRSRSSRSPSRRATPGAVPDRWRDHRHRHGVIYNVNQVSLRQAITPERMLGRMNATMRFIVWGTIPIGALVGGVLGARHRPAGRRSGSAPSASFLGFLPVLLSASEIAQRDPGIRSRHDARGADALLGVGRGARRADDRDASTSACAGCSSRIAAPGATTRWGTCSARSSGRAAKERRIRVLLIRRREGDPAADAVRRAILVDTVSREMAVRARGRPGRIALEAVADAPVAELRGAA